MFILLEWKLKAYFFFSSEPYLLFQISYLWYSTIGFLVTIVAGLIISGLTGFQNPKDVDADLLSPPVRDLLDSLPNNLKERLNIPLKQNHQRPKDIALKGVVNIAMDISDEKVEANKKTESPSNGKIM